VLLNLIVIATGNHMPTDAKTWRAFFIMGALNNVIPFSLILWGQTQITGSLASILNATTPLWGVLLAHGFTRDERLTPNRLAGVLLGLGGVVLTIGPDALKGIGLHALAQLAVIGAALSYALASIFGKRFKAIPPFVTAAGQVTGTALTMIPLVLLIDRPWERPMPGIASLGALLGLGVLCTATAYTIYFTLLKTAGATNLLLVTFLIPVNALLLGSFILGETLASQHFMGMGLIGLGLAAIDGRIVPMLHKALRRSGTEQQPDDVERGAA